MPKTAQNPTIDLENAKQKMALVQRQVDAVILPRRINDQATYITCAQGRVILKRALTAIDEERKKLVKPANDFVRHINALSKPTLADITGRLGTIDYLLRQYELEQEEKAQAGARKEASRAEKQGAPPQIVQAIVENRLARALPVVEGLSTRTLMRGELVDIKLLCAAIAAGDAPVELVTVSQSALNALAKSGMPMPNGTQRVEEKIHVSTGAVV